MRSGRTLLRNANYAVGRLTSELPPTLMRVGALAEEARGGQARRASWQRGTACPPANGVGSERRKETWQEMETLKISGNTWHFLGLKWDIIYSQTP